MKAVLALFVILAVASARVTFTGHKVIRMTLQPGQVAAVSALEPMNLDWWKPYPESTKVPVEADLRLSPEQFGDITTYLTQHGIAWEIMIEDVEELDRLQRIPASNDPNPDWFAAYHDYNSTMQWTRDIAANYSSIATLVTVGTSYEKRPMLGIRVRGKGTQRKPQIFYDGGIHAREWIAPATVQYVLFQLVSNYGKDQQITNLVDGIDWTICPIFNTDGYQYTHSTNRMWRKTRKPNSGSACIGTDPCRNSDDHWGGKGASKDPCSDTFMGAKPFDNPEVKAIADYVTNLDKTVGPVRGYINFHSYSQLWMSPWSYDYVHPQDPEYTKQRTLNRAAVAAIKASSGLTYREGPGAETIYPASGDITDYVYDNCKTATYAVCVELRDTGRYGFLLPPDQIIPTGKEIWEAAKVMARQILSEPVPWEPYN